jgi:ribosomal protein S18 acetylase RimI-like enzyme
MCNLLLDKIIFRKMNENDKELFINLRFVFLMDRYSLDKNEKIEIENSLKIYFDEHINKNDFIGIVGEYNGNVVSTAYLIIYNKPATLSNLYGKVGTLVNVYTYPEYRKKGIAKKLIKEIINEGKNQGIKYFDLFASEEGYNIYKELGFKDIKDVGMYLKI